jgi:hypothetical protein
MDQKILTDAVGKHLDAIAFLLNWFIATAFAMSFAGITRQEIIEVLGLKVKSRDAFHVAALITLVTLLGIFLLLLRVRSVMSLLDDEHFLEGLTKLTANAWYLNPFSFFGNSPLAYLHGTLSYFLFFTIVGLSAVPLAALQLSAIRYRRTIFLLQAATGMAVAAAVWGVYSVVLGRLHGLNADLYSALASTFMGKNVCLTICPIVFKLVRDALLAKARD